MRGGKLITILGARTSEGTLLITADDWTRSRRDPRIQQCGWCLEHQKAAPTLGEGFGPFRSLVKVRLERERSVIIILRGHGHDFVSAFKNPYTFLALLLDLALHWPSRVVLSLFI